MQDFNIVKSVYIASQVERLDNVSNRFKIAPDVRMLFLFKRGDKHTNDVHDRMKKEYCLANILYYNEAKLRIYAYELRMEFYLEIL